MFLTFRLVTNCLIKFPISLMESLTCKSKKMDIFEGINRKNSFEMGTFLNQYSNNFSEKSLQILLNNLEN